MPIPHAPAAPPPPIPAGYYDPALDAQLRAANRGYGDFQADNALAGTRAIEDYGFTTGDIRTGFARTSADYQRNTALLARSFGILADQQRQRQAQAGILSGGISLLSAQKRAANQGIQQTGLDIGFQRAQQNEQTALGRAAVGFQRGVTDRATGLARAGRENTQFGLDTEAEKAYQAQQAGYVAPKPPKPGGGKGHGGGKGGGGFGMTEVGRGRSAISRGTRLGQGGGGRPGNQGYGGQGRVKPGPPRRGRRGTARGGGTT